jgi:transmembrane sensor
MFKQFRHNRIRARARRWLVRISAGDISDRELQRFNRWLAADPAHRTASLSVASVWSELDLIEDDILARYPLRDLLADSDDAQLDSKQNTRPRHRTYQLPAGFNWFPVTAVASVLAVIIFTSLWHGSSSQPQPLQYISMIGKVEHINLIDGSTIVLGPKSNITVRYSEHQRNIRLIDGEAFFDVAKDPQRPFIVSAKSGSITAVGTAFNVHSGYSGVTVTVHEGRVNLETMSGSDSGDQGTSANKLLDAGQEASFDQITGISVVQAVDLQQRSQWRFGRMLFNDKPLSDVIMDINRYSTLQVTIAEKRLSDIKVNGSFELGQTKTLLKAMEKMLPIRVQMTAEDSAVLFYRTEQEVDL